MNSREALEIIRTYHNQISLLCKGKLNNKIINAENQIEKDLEILEIIKNKRLSVNTLIVSIIGAINPLKFYNEEVSSKLKLTQQEFDLLKEWLENE